MRALRPLTLDELFSLEMPPVAYVVDGILPRGSLTLHAAREKAGKSLQGIDLCASVALGESFLDRAVRQGAALYVPAEENLRDVRTRIETRLAGWRDAPLLTLPVNGATEDRVRLDDAESVAALHRLIIEIDPDVVYLDPFRELHNLAEDSADMMGPLLRPLRQIAHETDTAVVLAHHMGRQSGQARGSTAIRASCDQEWAFTRTDDDGDSDAGGAAGRLVVEGRFGPRQTIGIRLGDGLRWQPSSLVLVEPTTSVRSRILAFLTDADAWHAAEAIAAGIGVALKTTQNSLSAMNREQPCPVAREGTGKRGDPRRYHALTRDLWRGDPPPIVPESDSSQTPIYTGREQSGRTVPDASRNNGSSGGNNGKTVPDSDIWGVGNNGNTPPPDGAVAGGCADCGGPAPADGQHWCLTCRGLSTSSGRSSATLA